MGEQVNYDLCLFYQSVPVFHGEVRVCWAYPCSKVILECAECPVMLHCSDAFLGGRVGSRFFWTWVMFRRWDRLNCLLLCMLDWATWWVGPHRGLWRLGWNRCLLLTSLVGWVWNWCHNHIEQIDTCVPYLMWLGIFLSSCGYLPPVIDDLGEHCVGEL